MDVSATYVNADVRIEETLQDDEMTLVRSPRTQQSKPCGQPGEYIIVPPQFFLNADQSTTKEFGDPGTNPQLKELKKFAVIILSATVLSSVNRIKLT